MAGSDPTTVPDLELVDVDAIIARSETTNEWLEKIYDQVRSANRRRAIYRLVSVDDTVTNRFTTTTRLFVETLVWSVSTVGPLTLELGSGTYTFISTVSPIVIPFPIVVDRGTDIRGNYGAVAQNSDLYIIGTVE